MRFLRRGSGRTRILRWLQAFLGVALAAATFYLLSRLTDGAAVFNALQYFKWHMLFLIVPLFALQVWSRLIRWSQILEKDTAGKSLLFLSMMTGYAENALFPVGFGKASRIYVLRRKGNVPSVTHGFLLSLDVNAPLWASILIVGATSLGMAVPTAPGYLGVYHGIVVACLSLFGVHADTALATALVLHAFGFFPSAAIGLYCIWSGKLLINSTQTNESLE